MLRILFFLVLLLPSAPAWAQNEPRWALVIGNNDYQRIGKLGAAVNDAAAMAKTLKELGFEVLERPNLTRAGTYRAVRQLAERAAGAVVIVYYAGHGVQVGGRNYLLPVDIEATGEGDVEDNAVPVDDVLNLLAGAKAKLTVAFLDACRDNPLPPSVRAVGRGMAQQAAPRGLMVVYSAGVGERALDNLGRGDRDPNGLFVRELMPELLRPGMPLDRAVEAAAVRISEKAQAIGHDQNPAIYKAYYGEFFLSPGEAASTVVQPSTSSPDPHQLEATFWDSIKDSREAEDFRDYLERFGDKGMFASLAQRRLAALSAPKVPAPAAPVQPMVGVYGDAARKPGDVFRDCPQCPEMVVVPAGSFMMGSPANEVGHNDREGPQHQVTFARPFAAGRHEVTFEEWDACVAEGGCGGYRPDDHGWGRGRRPVIEVSWHDAKAYVDWLSRKTGETYRLLSEAEWEYAARAGTRARYWWGDEIGKGRANCEGCGSQWDNKQTAPVGSFAPNPWGLFDVHGNVIEWVEDLWHSSYRGAPADGSAWLKEGLIPRVFRSGSWGNPVQMVRAADRSGFEPSLRMHNLGFRIARDLQ